MKRWLNWKNKINQQKYPSKISKNKLKNTKDKNKKNISNSNNNSNNDSSNINKTSHDYANINENNKDNLPQQHRLNPFEEIPIPHIFYNLLKKSREYMKKKKEMLNVIKNKKNKDLSMSLSLWKSKTNKIILFKNKSKVIRDNSIKNILKFFLYLWKVRLILQCLFLKFVSLFLSFPFFLL